jgi:hypothetical protein
MHLVATVDRQKTMTNMNGAAASTYVDIYNAAFEPDNNLIDFEGATKFRIVFEFDRVGTGTLQLRWVDKADNTNVLWESAAFTADQDPADTDWLDLPAAFNGAVVKTIEWQAKSTAANDDPVARAFRIFLK